MSEIDCMPFVLLQFIFVTATASTHSTLLLLHAEDDIPLGLVKGNIALDLLHALERLGIVPRRVLELSLVGSNGVVGSVAFVGTVSGCRGRGEVGFGDGVGWELAMLGC